VRNELIQLNVTMAKSGNNENKIEKLVRVGFYELEKTIGKQCAAQCLCLEPCYLINNSSFSILVESIRPKITTTTNKKHEKKKTSGKGNFAVVKLATNSITKSKVRTLKVYCLLVCGSSASETSEVTT
jgi:hypothetical protein